MKIRKKDKAGISLIVLVITIIIIIIIATTTILFLNDSNIIRRADEAALKSQIAEEKSTIGVAMVYAEKQSSGGDVTAEDLQYGLNENFGENKAEASKIGDIFEVLIKEKNYYYTIEDNKITGPETVANVEFPGDITRNGALDGSEDKPYEISCIEDLVAFSNMTNGTGKILQNGVLVDITKKQNFDKKTVKLTRNLNFKSKYSYVNPETTVFGNINGNDTDGNKLITEMTTGTGFKCMYEFCGVFDGNNKKLSNLYIHNETSGTGGLFNRINGGTDQYTAVINLGVIGNVYSSGTVASIVQGHYNNGRADITNCYFEGKVESISGTGTAGLVATSQAPIYITDCYNKGEIVGANAVGGIIGCGREAYIKNCYNTGDISGKTCIGGICGLDSESITDCYNAGNINAIRSDTGGIQGGTQYYIPDILRCYNTATVTSSGGMGTGGIIGNCNGTIVQSYNTGDVHGYETTAGIAGKCTSDSRILNCYNVGDVYKSSARESGYGVAHRGIIISCYNKGNLISNWKSSAVSGFPTHNSFYLSGCGASDATATELNEEALKLVTPTLNKAYDIDAENKVTIKEDGTMQKVTLGSGLVTNVWVEDITNINEGYPILSWQVNK